MLTLPFFEILEMFFKDLTITHPRALDLKDFSRSELERQKYELVGDLNDLHFYEKDYKVRYYRHSLSITFKRYFYLDCDIGSGFLVGPGLRLISVLKWHDSFFSKKESTTSFMEFYFSEGSDEGAVIFNDSLVLRFNQWDKRSGYSVATIESDFSKSDVLNKLATDSVKKTMQHCRVDQILLRHPLKHGSIALFRLLKYLSKTGGA